MVIFLIFKKYQYVFEMIAGNSIIFDLNTHPIMYTEMTNKITNKLKEAYADGLIMKLS